MDWLKLLLRRLCHLRRKDYRTIYRMGFRVSQRRGVHCLQTPMDSLLVIISIRLEPRTADALKKGRNQSIKSTTWGRKKNKILLTMAPWSDVTKQLVVASHSFKEGWGYTEHTEVRACRWSCTHRHHVYCRHHILQSENQWSRFRTWTCRSYRIYRIQAVHHHILH